MVLSEISDVLNMRWQSFGAWDWEEPVYINQQRQRNGRYRFYPGEEVLNAIFLNHIGQACATLLNSELHRFVHAAGVWKEPGPAADKKELNRRAFYLRHGRGRGHGRGRCTSVAAGRRRLFFHTILLDHLPKEMNEMREGGGHGFPA